MKPGGGRAKGRAFEQTVARACRAIWPEAKRGLQGRGGAEAPDVDVPEWWIETKAGKPAKDPVAALEQAERDATKAGDTRHCVAVCKVDRRPPTATLRLAVLAPGWTDACGDIPVTMAFEDWLAVARRF